MICVLGDTALSLTTMRRWYNEFEWERYSIKDEPRSDRPPTANKCPNVETRIENDPKLASLDTRITEY